MTLRLKFLSWSTSEKGSLGSLCSAACCWQCCRTGRRGESIWDLRKESRTWCLALLIPGHHFLAQSALGGGEIYLWWPTRTFIKYQVISQPKNVCRTHSYLTKVCCMCYFHFTFCDCLVPEVLALCLDSSAAGGCCTGQPSREIWTTSGYLLKSSGSMSRSSLQWHGRSVKHSQHIIHWIDCI